MLRRTAEDEHPACILGVKKRCARSTEDDVPGVCRKHYTVEREQLRRFLDHV